MSSRVVRKKEEKRRRRPWWGVLKPGDTEVAKTPLVYKVVSGAMLQGQVLLAAACPLQQLLRFEWDEE